MADHAPEDPLEEQLKQIRAQRQAKFEADMAAQKAASQNTDTLTVQKSVQTQPRATQPPTMPPTDLFGDAKKVKLSAAYINLALGNALAIALSGQPGLPPRPTTSTSSDLDEAMRISKQTAETDIHKYEALENQLVSRGLRIETCANDGNCLFSAVSHQVVGTKDGHEDLRAAVVAHMIANRERYEPFATEEFDSYIAAMSCPGEYGTNLEIQAISEIQSRPIEVYNDESGAEPMNIFQGSHHNPNPIRLSYHRGNHYNAVVPITDEEFVVPPTSFGKFNSIPGTQ